MKIFGKKSNVFVVVVVMAAFLAGCSNLWDYQPKNSNNKKPGNPTDQTPPPSLNTLTFWVNDGSGTPKEVTVQVSGDTATIAQIKAAYESKYGTPVAPEGFDADGHSYEGDQVTEASGSYASGTGVVIGFTPKKKGYTASVTVTTAGGADGERIFVTDDTWEEDQSLPTILEKAGLSGPSYEPGTPPSGWTFEGWADADDVFADDGSIKKLDTNDSTTSVPSGKNIVAVYEVAYKLNIGGTDYPVKVPVTAPNEGATWEKILAVAKKDNAITVAAGGTNLESLLWANADGDDPAQLRGKQYPANTTFVQQSEFTFNVYDANNRSVSVSLKKPSTSTVTLAEIIAAAKASDSEADFGNTYGGSDDVKIKTWSVTDINNVPQGDVKPVKKEVYYTIVYDPTQAPASSKKAAFEINHPATYTEESLKDIFAKAKVDTNTAKIPTASDHVALYLSLNSGKVFTGWKVPEHEKLFAPSEIDNNKRAGETAALPKIKSGAVITAQIDTPHHITIDNYGTTIEFTEIESTSLGNFYVQNTEITRGQWKAVMSENGEGTTWHLSTGSTLWSNKNASGDENEMDLPITHVSWYEAIAFCNFLSIQQGRDPVYYLDMSPDGNAAETDPKKWGTPPTTKNDWKSHTTHKWDNIKEDETKNGYRLPDANRWLYAAKGGEDGPYKTYSGTTGNTTDDLNKVTWYKTNSSNGVHKSGEKGGDFPVRDMCGNVWEWCWGETTNRYNGNDIPTRPARGGGYNAEVSHCTLSGTGYINNGSPAEYMSKDFGFRIIEYKIESR